MDVTPQELRGTEIKEAFRGFNRDEVDDLLERAAVTIEGLTRQVQDLEAQLATKPAAPPTPATGERPLPSSRDDADMLQRTLVLAQRAADETVAEAQAQARQLLEESEAHAHALVSEAETNARRIAESEHRRLEDEINDLARRRDLLAANADALEQYVSGYRDRVRAAIEADLNSISRDRIDAPSPRPELHEIELPPARERVERSEPTEEPVGASRPAESERRDSEWPPPANAATGAGFAASSTPASALRVEDPPLLSSSSWLSDVDFSTSEPEAPAASAPWERATAEHQPFAADVALEPAAPAAPAPASADPVTGGGATIADDLGDDLDDDAFFASLREAVRDDAPLGPRDEPDPFFEEPREERRSRFRRRG